MISISNNGFISVHRGDSFKVPLLINTGTRDDITKLYIKSHPRAKIYFGVMEPNQPFEEAVIKKMYTTNSPVNEQGDLVVKFKPSDTEYLYPGHYYYSIKAEVTQMKHNVNYDMKGTSYILVYGWIDEYEGVTVDDLRPRFLPDKIVDVIGVNRFTNQPVKLFALLDEKQTGIDIYSSLDRLGKPTSWTANIKLEDLAASFKSELDDVIVDTIVPPTDFVIYE